MQTRIIRTETSSDGLVNVVALNKSKRLLLLDDDTVVPMVSLCDSDGDEVSDIEDAVYTVFMLPDGKWSYCFFADYDEGSLVH